MAFTIIKTFVGSWVSVYTDLYSAPTNYNDPQMQSLAFLAYDSDGNLFVQGFDSGSHLFIAELPKGSSTFINYPMDEHLSVPGVMRWDGQYLVVRTNNTLNRLAIAGSVMTVVSKTQLAGGFGEWPLGYWIQDGLRSDLTPAPALTMGNTWVFGTTPTAVNRPRLPKTWPQIKRIGCTG